MHKHRENYQIAIGRENGVTIVMWNAIYIHDI